MKTYLRMQTEIDVLFRTGPWRDIGLLESTLTPRRIANVVGAVLADTSTLAAVAARSCRLAQGFLKIILMEGPPEMRYRLRYHIWDGTRLPAGTVAEVRHCHDYDLASRLLVGTVEDHWYDAAPADQAQQNLHARFERALPTLPAQEVDALLTRLEIQESRGRTDFSDFASALGLCVAEIEESAWLFRKHGKSGPEGVVRLEPHSVHRCYAGSFRVQLQRFAHRLLIDPTQYTCAACVTSPPKRDVSAGSFLRTAAKPDTQPGTPLTVDELRAALQTSLDYIG